MAVSTTQKNIKGRQKGFSVDDLPQSFQDAVKVTIELGQKYLWIDSLCIIQGPDGDWDEESQRMEDVFASAYCTIAATSATDWNSGFLRASPQIQTANFRHDVLDAPLNSRAWVLQERVLSQRTIHFTKNQMYWECGEAMRCEDFTRFKWERGREKFIQDSAFPEKLEHTGYFGLVDFFQYIFARYSRSGMTDPEDRRVAISSLIQRIKRKLCIQESFGILGHFVPRLLLWKRVGDELSPAINYKQKKPPSWSWMMYPGPIEYIGPSYSEQLRVPNQPDLRLITNEKTNLHAVVRMLRTPFEFKKQKDTEHTIHFNSEQVGKFWPDLQGDIHTFSCVAIGWAGRLSYQTEVYVIMVRKNDTGEYSRVGIATVQARMINEAGAPQRLI